MFLRLYCQFMNFLKGCFLFRRKERKQIKKNIEEGHSIMKRFFLKLFAAFFLFSSLSISAVFSQPQARGASGTHSPAASNTNTPSSKPQFGFIWDYAKPLGLTKTQLGAMKMAFEEFQKDMIKLNADLSLSELNLQDLLNKKASLKKIKLQVEKSAEISGEIRYQRIKLGRTILGVLTPEQLAKWHEMVQKFEASQTSHSSQKQQ